MTIPNADRAVVEETKIRDYLLSDAHPVGRFKARIFLSLGYTAEEWGRLRDGLLSVARSGELARQTATPHGRKFEVDGMLNSPSGRSAPVRTVWIIRANEDFPRLVTAFPR